MSAAALRFLIGLAALTFIFAGMAFFAYDIRTARERLHQRVSLLRPGMLAPVPRSQRERPGDRRAHPIAPQLHGDELELARRLELLHVRPELAPQLLVGLRLFSVVIVAFLLALLGYRYAAMTTTVGLAEAALVGGVIGWMVPHVVVQRLIARRKRAILHALPDAIELLVIAVEAGLSLEDAIGRIIGELHASQPVMAEELMLTSADLKILPSRDDALRRLAERIDLPSVHSVVSTLSQTLKYGTPLAQALRTVAAELRNDALIRIEEQANRMPVLLTVPMILFILPSLFMIIGGPAFLSVLDVLARW